MKSIGFITNASYQSGVGYRAYHLAKALKKLGENVAEVAFPADKLPFKPWPGVLGSKSVNWIRWGRTLQSAEYDRYDITNQTLAFLAKRLSPTVVTVHDLIELIDPQDWRATMLNRYLYSGITSADHIITVSEYTKKTLKETYGVSDSVISVIPNAVGDEFYPIEGFAETIGYQELRRDLKLGDAHPIVLFVGSDHPRKNLPVALEAFTKLQKKRPDAVFLKVGDPGILAGREVTLATIDQLSIKSSVRLLGNVSYGKLNLLYNLSDVLVFPSTYEGFGLPPLQAMAAGLPIVTSSTTSLPEVVGDAALTHDPADVDAFSSSLERLTSDREAREEYRRQGLNRAKLFSWKKAAREVQAVYQSL